MIVGVVDHLEARVRLSVYGTSGKAHTIEAVIDTGYGGVLSLPPAAVRTLALPWFTSGRGILANGSETLFDRYSASIAWDGRRLDILIDEADTDPLIGMMLLEGYELKMQVRRRGKVVIKRLRKR